MTARDLFRMVEDSAVPNMAAFRPVLELLAEHGGVSPIARTPKLPGRPAERWAIHPQRAAFFQNIELLMQARRLSARTSARRQIEALVRHIDAECEQLSP